MSSDRCGDGLVVVLLWTVVQVLVVPCGGPGGGAAGPAAAGVVGAGTVGVAVGGAVVELGMVPVLSFFLSILQHPLARITFFGWWCGRRS